MQNSELITTEVVQELLCKQAEIPPKFLRKNYLSSDGQNLWDSVEFEYYHFHSELTAYFQGLPSQLENLDEKWRDYLEAKKHWFLALYELIRTSWKYLDVYHIDRNGRKLTPGLLTAEILESESKGKLLPAIAGRAEIAPRRNYELNAKIAKAAHKGDRSVKQLYKDSKRNWGEFYQAESLEVAVLSYCRFAATQDKYVKSVLENYNLAALKMNAAMMKHWKYAKAKQQLWEGGSIKTS